MASKITLHGKEVIALSASGLARMCLTSDTTISRMQASGRLRPAQEGGTGGPAYFFVEDVERLRAENLAAIRAKVGSAELTADERHALATAGMQDLAAGLAQLKAMFAQLAAQEAAKKNAGKA